MATSEERDEELAALLREVRALRESFDAFTSTAVQSARTPSYAVAVREAAPEYAVAVRLRLPLDQILINPVGSLERTYEVAVRAPALDPEGPIAQQ